MFFGLDREILANHTYYGGNWTWDGDNIILQQFPGFNETQTLVNGIISVSETILYLTRPIDFHDSVNMCFFMNLSQYMTKNIVLFNSFCVRHRLTKVNFKERSEILKND